MKAPHTDREFTNREENPLLHDTWKLLNKYRDVTWSLELSVQQVKRSFEIEYGTSIDEFLDSIYLAGVELSGTDIEYQAKCIERSNKMLKLVDTSIELLRSKHQERRNLLLGSVLYLPLPAGSGKRAGHHRSDPAACEVYFLPDVLPVSPRGDRSPQQRPVGVYV